MEYLAVRPGGDAAHFSTVHEQSEGWRKLTQSLSLQVAKRAGLTDAKYIEDIEHLADFILYREATKGMDHPVSATADQLLSHLMVTVVGRVVEIGKSPKYDKTELFKELARELLETAFPGRAADPNLPGALKWLLSGRMGYVVPTRWVANAALFGARAFGKIDEKTYQAADVTKFTWESLIEQFGKVCQENFAVVDGIQNNKTWVDITLMDHPGAADLAAALATQIMDQAGKRQVSLAPSEKLDASSANLLSDALNQIVAGNVSLDSDQAVVVEAKQWIKELVTGGLEIVFATILGKRPEDATAGDRRKHLIEHLAEKVRSRAEDWSKFRKEVEAMPRNQLAAALDKFTSEPARKLILDHALQNVHPNWEEEAREILLRDFYAKQAEELLKDEFDVEAMGKYFPKLYPAEKVFPLVYDVVGGLMLDHHRQIDKIRQMTEQAESNLKLASAANPPAPGTSGFDFLDWVETKLVANIQASVANMGLDTVNKLNKDLPPFLDSFIKEALKSEYKAVKDMREGLIRQAVFAVVQQMIGTPAADGNMQQQAARVHDKLTGMVEQLSAVVAWKANYAKEGLPADFFETDQWAENPIGSFARNLVDVLVPDELWNEMLNEQMRGFITKDTIAMVVAEYVGEIADSMVSLNQRAEKGKALLNALVEDKERGDIARLVQTSIASAVASTHAMADAPGKVAARQPEFINALLKKVVGSQNATLTAGIDGALETTIYAILGDILTRDADKLPMDNLIEALGGLVDDYNEASAKPGEKPLGVRWLERLVTQDLWKETVPPTLQSVLTREKFDEWLVSEYAAEVDDAAALVRKASFSNNETVQRARTAVKKMVYGLNKSAGEEGLLGYGGFVRELEKAILGRQGPKVEAAAAIHDTIDSYVDGIVGAVIGRLTDRDAPVMQAGFLLPALSAGLVNLQVGSKATLPPLGPGFDREAALKVLHLIYPQAAAQLHVPESVKEVVWAKLAEAVAKQLGQFTNKEERQQLVMRTLRRNAKLSTIPYKMDVNPTPAREFRTLLTVVAQDNAKSAVANMFGEKPGFFANMIRGILTAVAMAIVGLVVRSMSGGLWRFITEDESDDKVRYIIKGFLESVEGQVAGTQVKVTEDPLAEQMRESLVNNKMMGKLLSRVLSSLGAKAIIKGYGDSNMVDLLAGPAPKPAATANSAAAA